jgi:hypothetical protein
MDLSELNCVDGCSDQASIADAIDMLDPLDLKVYFDEESLKLDELPMEEEIPVVLPNLQDTSAIDPLNIAYLFDTSSVVPTSEQALGSLDSKFKFL